MGLGTLGFTVPWLLAALLLLPAIWYLLRITPPPPKLQVFPGFDLIRDLIPEQQISQRTPWWLLLLRLLIAALIIIGFAGPILNNQADLGGEGSALILVDDGMLSAQNWDEQREQMVQLARQLGRRGQSVHVVRLAPDQDGNISHETLSASQWIEQARALEPRAWPADYRAAGDFLARADLAYDKVILFHPGHWLNDEARDDARSIWTDFARLPSIMTYAPQNTGNLYVISELDDQFDEIEVTVHHPSQRAERALGIRLLDESGAVLKRETVDLEAGRIDTTAKIPIQPELGDRLAFVEAGDDVHLLSRWHLARSQAPRITGLLTDQSDQPLLSEGYYLERALRQFAQVHRGRWDDIRGHAPSMVIIPDETVLHDDDTRNIRSWMADGGVVLRFAGPRLAQNEDDLVPVPLRAGNRELGSALTWSQPLGLSSFSANSVLRDIVVPEDVEISRQVLARPGPDLAAASWATLEDGTPLITARPEGRGWLVLVHTTANTSWSNLVLSGSFIDILESLISLSGQSREQMQEAVVPVRLIDWQGQLVKPDQSYVAADTRPSDISPAQPAGLYGPDPDQTANIYHVHNAGPAAADTSRADSASLPGTIVTGLDWQEVDLGKHLLWLALILVLVDTLVSWLMKGVFNRRMLVIIALIFLTHPMMINPTSAQTPDVEALTQRTHLAYVRTGLDDVDRVSHAGLSGLGRVLTLRTSVEPAAPVGVDPAVDDLSLFPVLYWPIDERLPPLEPDAITAVRKYLEFGGLILMDLRDAGESFGSLVTPRQQWLQAQREDLQLPALETLPNDHVLRRSFYLLDRLSGRFDHQTVWIDTANQRQNDGVASLIVGSHDWAAAWALDDEGFPMLAVVPGGEEQRELAFRFGVNWVMYALTGNYKSDQVHVPVLLERMQQ